MMRARVPRSRVTHERWLVSYADFITLLFGLFVVMFAFARQSPRAQRQVAHAIESNFHASGGSTSSDAASGQPVAIAARPVSAERVKSDLEHVRAQLNQDLAQEVSAHIIALRMNRDGLVISLREAGFFASGSAVPGAEAEVALGKIARSLDATPYDLRVEGHTDNMPMHSAEFASNWELSSARATRIARMLLALDTVPPDRISVSGYGEFRPVADNATAEGRAQNRRVDLVLVPRVDLDLSLPEVAHSPGEWQKITDGDTH